MGRKIITVIAGIIFFLAIYLGVSYSLFKDAVNANEKHIIKQSRLALREVSDRMANFLSAQNKSLQLLAMMHEVQRDISLNSFRFVEKISFMELTSSDIFVVFNEKGDCVMTTPVEYSSLVKNRNFSQERFFLKMKKMDRAFVSRAVPIHDPIKNETLFFIFSFIPIHKKDSSFDGIIGVGIKVDTLFQKYYKPLETSFTGSIACVTDKDGNIEVFKENSFIKQNSSLLKPVFLPPIPASLISRKYHGSIVWKDADGKKNLIIYHPINIDNNLWIAQLKIPYSTIDQSLQPFYWKLFLSLLVLLVVAMGGIVLTIMTGRQISKLKRQIDELEILIDHEKKKNEVDKITSTDYFQDLLKHAEELKKEE